MASPSFSYESLFAQNVPITGSAPNQKAKYDFAVAYPSPETMPLDGLVDAVREAMDREGRDLSYYPHPAGLPALREFLADKLARDRNMKVSADDIVLTAGSGEAIGMMIQAMTDPGRCAAHRGVRLPWHAAPDAPLPGRGRRRQVRQARNHPGRACRHHKADARPRKKGQIPVHHSNFPKPIGFHHDLGAPATSPGNRPSGRDTDLRG